MVIDGGQDEVSGGRFKKKEICEQDTLSRWRVMGSGGAPDFSVGGVRTVKP